MGYTTDFEGSFRFSKPLTVAQYNYLKAFADTRHQKQNVFLGELSTKEAALLKQLGLTVGVEGEFYLGDGFDVIDKNVPPSTQPGLWCQWIPSDDGNELHWDGNEKFNKYVEWLEYYIKNFFKRWDIKLNGKVEFWGECEGDHGFIIVKDNVVSVAKAGDKTETEKTNTKFNIQNYLKTLLEKKIVTVCGLGETLVRHSNRTEIVNNSKITNRKIKSVCLTVYSRSSSVFRPALFIEVTFENSSDMYLIPAENQIEVI
jgi:hypothetical protein